MDNRLISIQSEGRADFDMAFKLLFGNCPGGKATHYCEDPKNGFVLLWRETEQLKCIKLPYPMDWKQSADLAWGWLLSQPESNYRGSLDHDGDSTYGFQAYNEMWGHISGCGYAFLAVIPIFAWHGK